MTEKQIIEGVPKIISNAESLYADAELLLKNERLARAYTLYQLSIEEISKAYNLANYLLFEDLSNELIQKRLTKEFKSHPLKTKKSLDIKFLLSSSLKGINLDAYKKMIVEHWEGKQPKSLTYLDNLKNLSLYVSFESNDFISPNEIITQDKVNNIKVNARLVIYLGKIFSTAYVKHRISFKKQIQDFEINGKEFTLKFANEYDEIIKEHKLGST